MRIIQHESIKRKYNLKPWSKYYAQISGWILECLRNFCIMEKT